MSDLRALQSSFQNYVLCGDQDMVSRVAANDDDDARERLDVYAEAYRLRLLEALEIDYPGLHSLLGDEQFEQAGRAYIDANPSDNPSVRWFGRHMAAFLRGTAPYSAMPLLNEMAAFEWAQGEVLDAADAPLIRMEDVATIAPEAWPGMRFDLHPSIRTLALEWNVPPLWQQFEAEQTPQVPTAPEGKTRWLLWRQEYMTHWRSVSADEQWSLDQISRGATFGEICTGLCEWVEEDAVALHAATLLKQWIGDGLISNVTLDQYSDQIVLTEY